MVYCAHGLVKTGLPLHNDSHSENIHAHLAPEGLSDRVGKLMGFNLSYTALEVEGAAGVTAPLEEAQT
jgi:hypothetical protein